MIIPWLYHGYTMVIPWLWLIFIAFHHDFTWCLGRFGRCKNRRRFQRLHCENDVSGPYYAALGIMRLGRNPASGYVKIAIENDHRNSGFSH